jgi:hypothetical protein
MSDAIDICKIVDLSGSRAEWRRVPSAQREWLKGEGLNRLREVWLSIATDAALFMPPIRLEPYAWVNKRTGDVFFGRMGPVDMDGNGNCYFGVHLPAATMLVLDVPMLRKILVHEFNHCFWHSVTAYLEAIGESERSSIIEEHPKLSYDEEIELLRREDTQSHVDPSAWFSQRDASEFLWYDSPAGVMALEPFSRIVFRKWVDHGFPVKKIEPTFNMSGATIPQAHTDRIEKLKRR